MLESGTTAPIFTTTNHAGETFDLTAERGRWVLLWWYPRADTPG